MATIETIVTALSSLSLPHGTGIFSGEPSLNHYVIVPDFDSGIEADNVDQLIDEHLNIEFYISGDYRPTITTAKTKLFAAGICVTEGQYIECIAHSETIKQHHYALSVIGRA
ncbi:MAG: hypothetical protein VB062_04595 [Christensenella sp.]|nr:hypothetical protein [Christensenella sp.]